TSSQANQATAETAQSDPSASSCPSALRSASRAASHAAAPASFSSRRLMLPSAKRSTATTAARLRRSVSQRSSRRQQVQARSRSLRSSLRPRVSSSSSAQSGPKLLGQSVGFISSVASRRKRGGRQLSPSPLLYESRTGTNRGARPCSPQRLKRNSEQLSRTQIASSTSASAFGPEVR